MFFFSWSGAMRWMQEYHKTLGYWPSQYTIRKCRWIGYRVVMKSA